LTRELSPNTSTPTGVLKTAMPFHFCQKLYYTDDLTGKHFIYRIEAGFVHRGLADTGDKGMIDN
jgi:hypothetical protein